MKQKTYQYDAIPPGRWFRLLHIHPGQRDDPLSCDLVTVAMDEAPKYKALSYVWGDPTKVEDIACSGFQREVTVSLFEGLRRIRSAECVEIAWADAICINQSDSTEKAHQVDLMGAIYDQAADVVVWLGDNTEDLAEAAFDGLILVNNAVKTGTHNGWSVVPEASVSLVSRNDPPEKENPSYPVTVFKSTLPSVLNDRHFEAIKRLYQLTWFTRVWVLQEVGLATRATAFWGDFSIDFSEIVLFIHFATADNDLIGVLGQDIKDIISGSPYYAFWNVWSTYDKKGSWVDTTPVLKAFAKALAADCTIDFVMVLEASRRFNVTNPLDHVFAFLGHPKALAQDTGRPLIQANYRLSLDDLHNLVASALAGQSLNFLVQAQNRPEALEPTASRPSWIPQWNVNDKDAPSAFWEAWDTSLRISRQSASSARVSENELVVQALLFDTVESHTNTMLEADFERFADGPGNLIEECWKLTERAVESLPHAYGDQNAPLAFASVLTCDYKTKRMSQSHDEDLIEDLVQYCAFANPRFFNEKLNRYDVEFRILPIQKRLLGMKFQNYGTNRRFFVTKGGYWGLGPPHMRQGDVCAILFGGDVPFALRPTLGEKKFRLVGQAYIFGVMYGEIVKKWEERSVTYSKEEIYLI